ncbi:MAG: glycoside hydrolase family 6 protein [Polyangiaceae bacterium]|nr:glycoside hydrolase family 6 protein [Polyangiaceae bacterium]
MTTKRGIWTQNHWSLLVGAAFLVACGGSQPPPAESAPAGQPGGGTVLLGNEAAPPEVEPLPAMPVTAATGKPAPAKNPFEGADFYLDPNYAAKIASTKTNDPAIKAMLEKMKKYPTGLWLDKIEALSELPKWLGEAEAQSKKAKKPVVPVIVVYDFPNRDCSAKASAGELDVEQEGEERYRKEFIDPIAAEFKKHPDLRIAVVLEPDSLPNVVTNIPIEKCAKSEFIYKHSAAYAIAQLSLPNVYIYVDAAHAGWLGWLRNRTGFAKVMKEVLDMAGGPDRIRGFATNTSNYNALDGDWGLKLESSSPTPSEYSYVKGLAETLAEHGIKDKGYVIDTSRNGVAETRTKWGNWCNIAKAGIGERPKVAPRPLLDAFFWIKPPGDSDGVADPSATRFDENCRSPDARTDAPEAGQWFPDHLIAMMKAANPPL